MTSPQDATLDALLTRLEYAAEINAADVEPARAAIHAHFAASAQTAAGEGREPETLALTGIEPTDGFWHDCSGCHESNEGVPTGQWSALFGCYMGGGCSECGGIGVKWDNTDYAKFVDEPVPCPTARCVYIAGHLCACRTEPTEAVAQSAPPPAAQSDGDALPPLPEPGHQADDGAVMGRDGFGWEVHACTGSAYTEEQMHAYARAAIAALRQQVPSVGDVVTLGVGEVVTLEGVEPSDGVWHQCSGCHESNEGYPTGPWSTIFGCHMGGGCGQCGGLGVRWDGTDYSTWTADGPAPPKVETVAEGDMARSLDWLRVNYAGIPPSVHAALIEALATYTPHLASTAKSEPANRTAMPEVTEAMIDAAREFMSDRWNSVLPDTTLSDLIAAALAAYDPAKAVGP